ncbi:MAG: hypothetical protein QXJ02_06570, partial [Candidatus Bathyarchaeia archaeon]
MAKDKQREGSLTGVLSKALQMLKKYPLCDHCLGRQFALLGHGVENDERGKSLKLTMTLKAHEALATKKRKATQILKIIAANGLSQTAKEVIQKIGQQNSSLSSAKPCYLCNNTFNNVERLAEKALQLLKSYEYNNFLVGIEMPSAIEEREDEFRAEFEVSHSENMRNEFGRL